MNVRTYFAENNEQLALYTKAITKAHSKKHPEVFEVHKLYQEIQKKAQQENWDLTQEFAELRQLTDTYTIPTDVCQTFEKTYRLLATFDQLQQQVNS